MINLLETDISLSYLICQYLLLILPEKNWRHHRHHTSYVMILIFIDDQQMTRGKERSPNSSTWIISEFTSFRYEFYLKNCSCIFLFYWPDRLRNPILDGTINWYLYQYLIFVNDKIWKCVIAKSVKGVLLSFSLMINFKIYLGFWSALRFVGT